MPCVGMIGNVPWFQVEHAIESRLDMPLPLWGSAEDRDMDCYLSKLCSEADLNGSLPVVQGRSRSSYYTASKLESCACTSGNSPITRT